MLFVTASPLHRDKQREREETLAERAREGAMPIVYVNQVGGQDELVFDGGSCVVDADGQLLARYYKQKLPNYRGFDEKRYFEPGNQPCVADIKVVAGALSISEDIWLSARMAHHPDPVPPSNTNSSWPPT